MSEEQALPPMQDGEDINLGTGLVYYGFNPAEHVVDLPIPPGAELGVGMDFNVDPMTVVVFWRLKDHVHYFREIEIPNADTEYILNRFTYHPPKGDQAARYNHLRAVARSLALDIASTCPPSRERSIALTKLEEAVMWANASIARNE